LNFEQSSLMKNREPSILFDTQWYVQTYTDVSETGMSAWDHFLKFGSALRRNPSPLFNTEFYLSQFAADSALPGEPFFHYLSEGWRQLKSPHPLFDVAWYLNGDSDANCYEPVAHYLQVGLTEGRAPHPCFKEKLAHERLRCAPDATQHQLPYPTNLIEPFVKYLERFSPAEEALETSQRDAVTLLSSSHFDACWYTKTYHETFPEIRSLDQDGLVLHYCTVGWKAGLDPSPTFNTTFYREQYPDVANALVNPLYHYLVQGKREGRMARPLPKNERDPCQDKVDVQYIRESSKSQLHYASDSYRTVAFYLPQFHPIPENNAWWGDGFTEWTNVKPAKPMFKGHYQPHQPSELGHYIIEDSSILRRQVQLAETYGVDAFCFYFYWFNGKTLLEKPIDLFFNDKTIDHGFCLCWANENWTRRWDGKESDVLLAQNYSHEDDLDFIKYISKYLQDQRYLRIDGKPVLLIYRPSLMPDPVMTTRIWRDWCIKNGIGDLHLIYTQSFECNHPAVYGCDAGVEFAPNIPSGYLGATPHLVTESVAERNPEFTGKIFDWTGYIERSRNLPHPGYPIYRCINPGWDNTARKKTNATIFINSSPRKFQQWALNALEDTAFAQGRNGLLFINAWNEWAEGAHLEPDQRYGYGYLDALRMARVRHEYRNRSKQAGTGEIPRTKEIAIVIHAFYPEILHEIIDYWQRIPVLQGVLFMVTTPPDKVDACRDVFESRGVRCEWIVFSTENHGRDILPFCKMYDFLIRKGIRVYCKLHTKKSKHRGDGDAWRNELFSGLLEPNRIEAILRALSTDSGIGIVLPREHILKMTEFLGANCDTVLALTARLGLPVCKLNDLPLVAGSMFWARIEALVPMHMLYSEEYFERECGQVDGTFAHAFERMLSISAACLGLEVADTDLQAFKPEDALDAFAFASRG
jgi:lipopolysaccharide biosynthesis protein